MSTALRDELFAFVQHEAELLDTQRFDEWLALFTDDARYWMPLVPGQTDAVLHGSLLHEDPLLLKVRVQRLRGARTFSQQPPSRCHHLLGPPSLLAADEAAGQFRLKHAFHYVESRGDEQWLYAGWTTHDLVRDGAGLLKIRLKRIDLLNCDAALPNIQLFM